MDGRPFEVVWELEPPTRPDLTHLHRQVDHLGPRASAFLVPDNHTGRATVSSIVVAHEVQRRGARAVACVNARDRNLLGFRRDLLTCSLHGVDELLLVYGDEPEVGERSGGLTVRTMVDECRAAAATSSTPTWSPRVAVTSRLAPLPAWKREADALYVQVSWSVEPLLRWREQLRFDGPVLAGVLALPSAATARRLAERIPQLGITPDVVARLEADPDAGVAIAAELVAGFRASGAVDGVHLVGGARHEPLAAALAAPADQVRAS